MTLTIISPQETLFQGEVDAVTLPGAAGSFTVLNNHAPIVSTLAGGEVTYTKDGSKHPVSIQGGIVEVSSNVITLCVR